MATTGTSRALAAAVAALLAVGLAGCVEGPPMPTPSSSPSATPTPTSTRNEVKPVLRPGQSAAANQQFFDAINRDLHGRAGRSDGETIVNTLVAAGFVKADMEVTYDATALGIQADAIIVSVRIGTECLIGQFSPGAYTGTILPVLGSGNCLVGAQKPIDW